MSRHDIRNQEEVNSFSSRSIIRYLEPVRGFIVSGTIDMGGDLVPTNIPVAALFAASSALFGELGVRSHTISKISHTWVLPVKATITDLRFLFQFFWHVYADRLCNAEIGLVEQAT